MTPQSTTLLLISALAVAGIAPAQQDASASAGKSVLDKTGMHWVLPFEKALAAAKKGRRILMIKPIAFGTDSAGGW